ncbi:MAG: DMT family transporter [Thermoanaerobaculum sp.]
MGRWVAVVLLFGVTVLWGATFPVVKLALDSASVGAFLALRFLLAFAALVATSYRRAKPRWEPASVLCGLLLFAGYGLQTAGLAETLPSRSAFVTSLSVILVPVLQGIFRGQLASARVWIAAGVALAGLVLLLRPETAPLTAGDGLTFLCAVAFAGHVLALAEAVKRQHPAAVNIVQLGVVALASPLLAALTPSYLRWTPQLGVALAVTGLLASALAFGVMAKVLVVLKPSETGVILAFEPVAAAVISVLLGYENVTASMILGGLLVASGVALVAKAEA